MAQQKTALIVGMAKSGIAAARLLYENGYRVIINDMKPEIPGLFDALEGMAYEVRLGDDPMDLLEGVDLLVPSPIIPFFKPFMVEAKRRGIEVISEIELGYRYAKADFVCITGTNGKTTCTTLTGEIFKAAGRKTFVLGNIGVAICAHAMETQPGDVIVAETAALQLEGNVHFRAKAAGVCNITPDHLDRFGSMENYIAAKAKILDNQTAEDFAVLNFDDPIVRGFAPLTAGQVLYFSRKEPVPEGMFLEGDTIMLRLNGVTEPFMDRRDIYIPGAHNLENAMLCALLALSQGVKKQIIIDTLKTFPGVEHRIEFVCERSGVRYINDSKGTNPDSTVKAIEAMDRPTVLILGGYDKHTGFEPVFDALPGSHIKELVVLGQTADEIIETAARHGVKDLCHRAETFEETMDICRRLAKPGDNVLLSPACASWGMFENYEQRGRIFKEIARSFT